MKRFAAAKRVLRIRCQRAPVHGRRLDLRALGPEGPRDGRERVEGQRQVPREPRVGQILVPRQHVLRLRDGPLRVRG